MVLLTNYVQQELVSRKVEDGVDRIYASILQFKWEAS